MEGRAPALLSTANCSPSSAQGLQEGQQQHHPQLQIFLLPQSLFAALRSVSPEVGALQAIPHQSNVLVSTPLSSNPAPVTDKEVLPFLPPLTASPPQCPVLVSLYPTPQIPCSKAEQLWW